MHRRLLATAGVTALAIAAPAAAQTSPPETLRLVETARGGTTSIVDRPPLSPARGARRRLSRDDTLVIANPLRDAAGEAAGRLRAYCAVTRAGGLDSAAGECLGVFALRAGRIYVTLPLDLAARRSTGAVLGGTGAYAGVRGTWTSVQRAGGGATDTLTFTR